MLKRKRYVSYLEMGCYGKIVNFGGGITVQPQVSDTLHIIIMNSDCTVVSTW